MGEDCRQLLADHLILTKHITSDRTSEESCSGERCSAGVQEFMLGENTGTYCNDPLLRKRPQHNYQHSERERVNSCSLLSHSAFTLFKQLFIFIAVFNIRPISYTLCSSEIAVTGRATVGVAFSTLTSNFPLVCGVLKLREKEGQ